jgi:hypothetical protein
MTVVTPATVVTLVFTLMSAKLRDFVTNEYRYVRPEFTMSDTMFVDNWPVIESAVSVNAGRQPKPMSVPF